MKISFKKIFQFVFYHLINLLIKRSGHILPKSLLVIRLDAIGDYVLFRNYLNELKRDDKYKDYSITLLGNIVWKELSEVLDQPIVDKFIWLDRKKFAKNLYYRYRILKEITATGYEVVIQPTYSREYYFGDNIVKLITANEKIASVGDYSNISKVEKNKSDKYYTTLLPSKEKIVFEFERNKEFFNYLLNQHCTLERPMINLESGQLKLQLPGKYAILFIGANAKYRKWCVDKFLSIGDFLINQYGYDVVVCGGPNDCEDSKIFDESKYINLVGKTTLLELLYVILNADCLVSNETSAPHFAVALGVKNVFVVSNGNHYGRFTPYPATITENYHVVFPPEIEKIQHNYSELVFAFGQGSTLDVNGIQPDIVKEKIDRVLSSRK
ncbi:glycosyltransferase family 9 protein [Thiotrichales bacterium 19X7-9]|nr:glycosyltransferase family 9 protein [Thiotrichales bacterium 19X7-9]